jgi:phage terminase Nu1 subunit (DNA packaging protein)
MHADLLSTVTDRTILSREVAEYPSRSCSCQEQRGSSDEDPLVRNELVHLQRRRAADRPLADAGELEALSLGAVKKDADAL